MDDTEGWMIPTGGGYQKAEVKGGRNQNVRNTRRRKPEDGGNQNVEDPGGCRLPTGRGYHEIEATIRERISEG